MIKFLQNRKRRTLKEEIEKQITMFIKEEDWNSLRRLLKYGTKRNKEALSYLHDDVLQNGDETCSCPILYDACCASAPLEVIRLFIKIIGLNLAKYRNPTRMQYPIHAAAEHQASILVIREISSIFPNALTRQDITGRVPLHWSCANGAMYSGLAHLYCQMCPSAIAVEDDNGETALEVLIDSMHIYEEGGNHSFGLATMDILHLWSAQYWEHRRKDEMFRLWWDTFNSSSSTASTTPAILTTESTGDNFQESTCRKSYKEVRKNYLNMSSSCSERSLAQIEYSRSSRTM